MIYSIEELMIYDFCCNYNFGFPSKISSVNKYLKMCQYQAVCYIIWGCSRYLKNYDSAGESVL